MKMLFLKQKLDKRTNIPQLRNYYNKSKLNAFMLK